jgi:Fur family zinc uptake transcriptional regulator
MTEIPILGKNQKLVYESLTEAGKMMTAYDLLDQLRPRGLRAPVQIYRALEKLAELGLVHRIESENAFVSCSHSSHDHDAAFAICNSCGTVQEISLPENLVSLSEVGGVSGFKTKKMMVELHGVCANCGNK